VKIIRFGPRTHTRQKLTTRPYDLSKEGGRRGSMTTTDAGTEEENPMLHQSVKVQSQSPSRILRERERERDTHTVCVSLSVCLSHTHEKQKKERRHQTLPHSYTTHILDTHPVVIHTRTWQVAASLIRES
jgi:hypothetical protein